MQELEDIKARNRRVEADKAWETSITRRSIITIITYLIAAWFMNLIKAPNPWLTALVPTGGYVLSTLSLPYLKQFWLKNIYKRNK